ncbi:uncharacterized protein B0J16DRAFT_318187 [Fusarium flagelliforme]|uniref:uncharacterized protein n=1 Tax=Fusarium flagelliforme TaxID=2675880 RepID=UPI001E8EEE5B|nr:uncharacterized protein B0J16DRAFT_318187 [Fusarium flagelliforme]KAH7188525.1 hypothetical protein B0J16DRAFT_318187 [Fusarium flagelliforme]
MSGSSQDPVQGLIANLSFDDKKLEAKAHIKTQLERFRQASAVSLPPPSPSANSITQETEAKAHPELDLVVKGGKSRWTRGRIEQVCFQFRDTGRCKYSFNCKHLHVYTRPPMDIFFEGFPTFDYRNTKPFVEEFTRMQGQLKLKEKSLNNARKLFSKAVAEEFYYVYGNDEYDLSLWQKLCKIIGIDAPTSLEEAYTIIRPVRVNIVDLVYAVKFDMPVQRFETLEELSDYTRDTGKIANKHHIYDRGGLLVMLLREINYKYYGERLGGSERSGL